MTGRQRRSAARWILVVRPPRERPSASRPGGFLSFATAPCGQFGRQHAAGAGGVLVRAHHGGVRAEGPVFPLGLIAPGPQRIQDLFPGPIQRPAAMPPIDALPVPEPRRQVTPRAAGPGTEQDPINHHAVIVPPVPLSRMRGHQRRQPRPFLIGQVMTTQMIIHPE